MEDPRRALPAVQILHRGSHVVLGGEHHPEEEDEDPVQPHLQPRQVAANGRGPARVVAHGDEEATYAQEEQEEDARDDEAVERQLQLAGVAVVW